MESHVFYIHAHYSEADTIRELEQCIDIISKLPPTPSTPYYLEFVGIGMEITPPILALLVQMFNYPIPQPPQDTSTVTTWFDVKLTECRFARDLLPRMRFIFWDDFGDEDDNTTNVEDEEDDYYYRIYCSPRSKREFATALASRTETIQLSDCPEILEYLFQVPKPQMVSLTLEDVDWPTWPCDQLGALIRRSDHIQELDVHRDPMYHYIDVPQILLDCSTFLDDRHFVNLVEALPTSQLEFLDVSCNNIQCPGLLAFAEQLPRIKSLKTVKLGWNPWEKDRRRHDECWLALVSGLRENYSVEILITSDDCVTMGELVDLYCYLNWAGRRLLTASSSISVPLGLWPLILERAGKDNPDLHPKMQEPFLRSDCIYFFLQNSPILSSICSTHSSKYCNPRKKCRLMELGNSGYDDNHNGPMKGRTHIHT